VNQKDYIMQLPKINLCYYPTSVFLLDDNRKFLNIIDLHLSKQMPIIFHSSSSEASDFFDKKYEPSYFFEQCISSNEETYIDRFTQSINIRNIHKVIYNPLRFSEVSILVIDYAMPEINGLEFSRHLRQKNPLIKIIMLTGEADRVLAIEAFNEGSIDKFIMKSTPNLDEVLLQAIKEQQIKYFFALSEKCFSNIKQSKGILNLLNDPAFIELFSKIYSEYHIAEYYLMDEQGSFLLLTADGHPSWLSIKNEQEINNYYEYGLLEQAPENVINALKTKQGILYFHTENDLQAPPSAWNKYLHPAKSLVGKETYYYAYIDNPKAYDIEPDKITSYEQYLDQLD